MSPSFLLTKTDRLLRRSSIFISLFLFVILLSRPFDSVAQIKLAWDPNTEPDIAGYQVYYGMTSRNYKYSIDVGNVTTYTIRGLKQGVTYYIALTAYDSANNESAFSNEVSGRINETVSTPTVLSGPMSGGANDSYTYTTGGSYSTLGHAVQYQFDWTGEGRDLSSWGPATQSKTWKSHGTYNVRVRARCVTDKRVISSWAGPVSVAITVPSLIKPNGGEVIPSGSFYSIQWGMPLQAIKFKLQYSINNGVTWKRIAKNIRATDYNWQVPAPSSTQSQCLTKVVGYDVSGRKVWEGRSHSAFTIEVGTPPR